MKTLRTIMLAELIKAGLGGQSLIDAMERVEDHLATRTTQRGQAGAAARAASLTQSRRSEIARKAANTRWEKP